MSRVRASLSLIAALALSASASAAPASVGTVEVTVTDVTNPNAPAVVATGSIPVRSAPAESFEVVSPETIKDSTAALVATLPQTAGYRSTCMVGEDGQPEVGPVSQVNYGLGGEAVGAGSIVRIHLVHAALVSQGTFERDGCAIDLPKQQVTAFRQTIKFTADKPIVQSRVSDGKAYEYRYVLQPAAQM